MDETISAQLSHVELGEDFVERERRSTEVCWRIFLTDLCRQGLKG